jgi:hypothetical protein
MKHFKRGAIVLIEDELWVIQKVWDKWAGLWEVKKYKGKEIAQVAEEDMIVLDSLTKDKLKSLLCRLLEG